MEAVDGIQVKKIRAFYWEAEVPHKNSIYYFPGYTKKGAITRAKDFLKEKQK